MPTSARYFHLDAQTKQRLGELVHYLNPIAAASKMWFRKFKDWQRNELENDFEGSYQQWGTIGMWQRIYDVSQTRAIVELAYKLDFISPSEAEDLTRSLGEAEVTEIRPFRPHWNKESGELLFRGKVVKKVKRRNHAKNVVAVLNSFQKEGWSNGIDDPLSSERLPSRLRDTVKSLNTNLIMIRFEADGSGERITWCIA